MDYGYVRVSSITQNIDRQMNEMYRLNLIDKNIYIDKQSGKNFERKAYQQLKKKLREKDLLIIKSIDRLGRNYKMIIEEWRYITQIIKADILVIDMPLLDTRSETNNLVGTFISDIVLQILSFVAETERENIKLRQAEGIRLAKARGVHMGRPKYKLPAGFNEMVLRYQKKEVTNSEAADLLNMKRGTFLKYANMKDS
ncbi:MAG TPA: recombinase family protein [Bacilli bacterium]|nr:recombinase family protein [Bacilli bacterium]